MDADERALFADSVRAALAKQDPDRFVSAVRVDGWAELCDEDEESACGVLFEAAGVALTPAPVLDLAVETVAPGARPAVRLDARADPAESDGHTLHVDAVVFGADEPAEVLVGFPELQHPDGRVVAIPRERLGFAALSGLDPELAAHRVRGEVALSDTRPVDGVTNSELLAHLRRCVAHELVGAGRRAVELAQEHVETRTQFGRPLGTWQTVAHRLADTHVELSAARAALTAAWQERSALAAAVAKCQSGAAALAAVDAAQQLFGAIGFTWEHPAHRYVRRCAVLDAVLGAESELAVEIGAHLLADRTLEPVRVDF